jgi:hypothetical protein
MISSAQQTFAVLGSSNIWDVARKCDSLLRAAGLPYAVVGGVAVCLHGYRRNTVDVDLLVRREDSTEVRPALEGAGFEWDEANHEFHSAAGVPVQFLIADEPAGNDAWYNVKLPDPANEGTTVALEGLVVVSLPRLIEMKLACGLGSPRRTHRDFADVVELIAVHGLGRDFARFLHKSVREEYRNLVLQAKGEA